MLHGSALHRIGKATLERRLARTGERAGNLRVRQGPAAENGDDVVDRQDLWSARRADWHQVKLERNNDGHLYTWGQNSMVGRGPNRDRYQDFFHAAFLVLGFETVIGPLRRVRPANFCAMVPAALRN